jgi:hypothetical protein
MLNDEIIISEELFQTLYFVNHLHFLFAFLTEEGPHDCHDGFHQEIRVENYSHMESSHENIKITSQHSCPAKQ